LTPNDALVYNMDHLATPSAVTKYTASGFKPGTYYFQCDLHPTTMNGTFEVAK
jgi:plastocyanin